MYRPPSSIQSVYDLYQKNKGELFKVEDEKPNFLEEKVEKKQTFVKKNPENQKYLFDQANKRYEEERQIRV